VLAGACVWERMMPGVTYIDHGARHDPIIPGKVDRGGAINTIAPHGLTSKNACGQATSGYLADVQNVARRTVALVISRSHGSGPPEAHDPENWEPVLGTKIMRQQHACQR